MSSEALSRRHFLAASGSCAAASLTLRAMPAFAAGPAGELAVLLDRVVMEEMRLMPDIACFFALDKGEDAGLRAQLGDRSPAGKERYRAMNAAQLTELRRFPRSGLADADLVNLDVAIFTREIRSDSLKFDYGAQESMLENRPYTVTHLGSAFQLHSFTGTGAPIATREDAEMDFERLAAYEKQIDDESERLRAEHAAGARMPDFLFARLVSSIANSDPDGESFLKTSEFGERLSKAGLSDDYRARAAAIYDRQVTPAIARQADLIRSLQPSARTEAGYWELPRGDEFYAQALRYYTTANVTPEQVHAFGREQAATISARMDALLRKQGLTKGSVGERMKALAARPDQIFPNTPAGREALLAYSRERVARARSHVAKVFSRIRDFPFEIIDLPPQAQTGGGGASATAPAADGSRPGSINLDLSNTLAYPKFSLPSLLYHEGYPGHQYELGLTLTNKLPLLRKTTIFSGFGEGWGLYSEQLADEIGLYDDDPLGQIGYLQGQLFRANRCVVDTGIHALRWKRAEAAHYLAEAGGDPIARVESEIDRYCVMGGQACAYKIGQSRFVALRDRARAKLGVRFDLAQFHDAILAAGHLPLELLETRMTRWIEDRARAA